MRGRSGATRKANPIARWGRKATNLYEKK